jgi:hypothetical protein
MVTGVSKPYPYTTASINKFAAVLYSRGRACRYLEGLALALFALS